MVTASWQFTAGELEIAQTKIVELTRINQEYQNRLQEAGLLFSEEEYDSDEDGR
jgi:hypothetical protein